ncbi:MAG: serine/threonine-protein kinase [Polyangia bacterium]|jgi:serine/threonine-protein kinase|nr:serine/threonine-protein kinase [Polyangia bacterium]
MDSRILGNRYRLDDVLGEGAVATVYRALDLETGEAVAVKIPKDMDDAEDTARLWVELRSLQRVRHPNTLRILEMGRSGEGQHYIAMELLEGRTLRARLLSEGRLPVPAALGILTQIFGALDACHEHGVIHRDVKPENVILTGQHEDTVKLIDFGMAKLLHDRSTSLLTQPHQLFGTPEYMAPERITGDPPTVASDIYAAGVLGFEMLVGRRPFGGRTPEEIMRHQLRQSIPRFAELDPPVSVPRPLRGVIRRCLRKVPSQRPSAASVLAILFQLQGNVTDPAPEAALEVAPQASPETTQGSGDPTLEG